MAFLRNTYVETPQGTVVVSTSKNNCTRDYETMVFSVAEEREVQFGNPLPIGLEGIGTESHELKKKKALRIHRTVCRRYDLGNRSFIFDHAEQGYRPLSN